MRIVFDSLLVAWFDRTFASGPNEFELYNGIGPGWPYNHVMLYILALLLPPVAVLLAGKPIQALLNLVLWCCLIVPGVIHACLVVHERYNDKRTRQIIRAMRA